MDAAFKTAKFPGLTDKQLKAAAADPETPASKAGAMLDELIRRAKADDGDMSVMTDGERLRFIKTGKAR